MIKEEYIIFDNCIRNITSCYCRCSLLPNDSQERVDITRVDCTSKRPLLCTSLHNFLHVFEHIILGQQHLLLGIICNVNLRSSLQQQFDNIFKCSLYCHQQRSSTILAKEFIKSRFYLRNNKA